MTNASTDVSTGASTDVSTDHEVELTPAQAVAESGFSLDTLRYYERVGLLGEVRRSASGHRRFTPHDLAWLGVLRCLRDTGMPIADMLSYAELVRSGDATVAERLAVLEAHDEQVEQQIRELRRQQQAIRDKIAYYREVL
ncbi:MerR family transcriptional regulator [Kitasatospora sp. NPDC096147]|uniref:MerR family transcriptional regulator n=1 Tax=Kitasatospora sp. NPDC096147 TaxID=3364093 RepID=UPI0038115FE3